MVLCGAEGLSRCEAARRLGIPEGTLQPAGGAKARLRAGLVARGVSPSAAAIPALLIREARAVTVPLSLLESTVQAATSVAAGPIAIAAISASVASLCEGVLKTMFVAKLKGIALSIGAITAIVSAPSCWPSPDQTAPAPEKRVPRPSWGTILDQGPATAAWARQSACPGRPHRRPGGEAGSTSQRAGAGRYPAGTVNTAPAPGVATATDDPNAAVDPTKPRTGQTIPDQTDQAPRMGMMLRPIGGMPGGPLANPAQDDLAARPGTMQSPTGAMPGGPLANPGRTDLRHLKSKPIRAMTSNSLDTTPFSRTPEASRIASGPSSSRCRKC